ncbi:MAG: HDIG domain-containing protein [Armatimonadetes bacterium]|nr:HDIG domain-containing protein [Armatimonadota bacterium]
MIKALESLRKATRGTDYEGRLYLVGGIVRDRILGIPHEEDIDIVLEGDAAELARFLFRAEIADHAPVIYARFGTSMVTVQGVEVEIVGARSESYSPESRKPEVVQATLEQDVLRRDFTINTLLENLHTGEVLDLTGRGMADIERGIIRTPTDPLATFEDDPLRMLRAVRFAARFGFRIEPEVYAAIQEKAHRLSIISKERIRDEFSKTLMTRGRTEAVEALSDMGLLSQFAPELEVMRGVTQNVYHVYDVWTHTLKALETLPEDSDLTLRLATLFHDIGKPNTRTVDEQGQVHFYTHQIVGAEITRKVLTRLRYPNEVVNCVTKMVFMHLRVGEYDEEWTDAAIRRLIRDAGPDLDAMIELTRVDKAAANPAMPSVDLHELERRIAEVKAKIDVTAVRSPLSGRQIMELLHIPPGPLVGKLKDFLLNEVIEGRLAPGDEEGAKELAKLVYERQRGVASGKSQVKGDK